MTATTTPLNAGTDIGETLSGKLYGRSTLHDATGVDAMGQVTAAPAPLTLLGRLKALFDAFSLTTSADRFAAIVPNNDSILNPPPKALLIAGAGNIRLKDANDVVTEFPVPAGFYLMLRPKSVMVATSNPATSIIGHYV